MRPNLALNQSAESSDFNTCAAKFIEAVNDLQTDTSNVVNLRGGDRAEDPELYAETQAKRGLIIEKTSFLFKFGPKPRKSVSTSPDSPFPDLRKELARLGFAQVNLSKLAGEGKAALPLWLKRRSKKGGQADAA